MYSKRRLRATQVTSLLLLAALAVCVVILSRNSAMSAMHMSLQPMKSTNTGGKPLSPLSENEGESIIAELLAADKKYDINRDFLTFCENSENISPNGDFLDACLRYINSRGYRDEMWENVTGYTFSVLYDIYTGRIGDPDVTVLGDVWSKHKTTLAFTGDVNLSHDWYNMVRFRELGGKVENCFSADLLDAMRGADILLVNNEFSISDRGAPLEGKTYTFRADPADLSIYGELGVDIVSLANNHVYDYGPDAFADTLSSLDAAGIPRIGAGLNETEASAVRYYISGGLKIAICSASSAEVNRFTPVADGDTPGVMGLYETEAFCRKVAEAKANSDIVIAYVHFGKENSNALSETQVQAAHDIVDAGADIVIGSHPHVLQPIEYYNGTPIVYSLGNFWFNTNTLDTAFLTVTATVGLRPTVRFYPCIQSGGKVAFADEENSARIIETMNSWSSSADIGEDNRVKQR